MIEPQTETLLLLNESRSFARYGPANELLPTILSAQGDKAWQ